MTVDDITLTTSNATGLALAGIISKPNITESPISLSSIELTLNGQHTGCIFFLLFSIVSFIHFCLFKKFIWSLTSTMVIIAKAYDADFRSQMT